MMRHLLVFVVALPVAAHGECAAGSQFVREVKMLLAEARAERDIIRVQQLTEKLWLLREREVIVCSQMERIAGEARRVAGGAPYHVGPTEVEVEFESAADPQQVSLGVGVGFLALRGEVAVPLAVPVGLMMRYEVSGRFELAALAGPLITGGDLEGNDKVGLFGLAEGRFCITHPTRWFCPVLGGHVNAPSVNFADGSFFLVEGGAHAGLFLPLGDAGRIVARYGIGQQESDRAAGWLNRVTTVTVEARVW